MKNASKSLKTVLRDRITKSELILYSDLKKVGFGSGERSTVSFDELDRMISVWKIKVDQLERQALCRLEINNYTCSDIRTGF